MKNKQLIISGLICALFIFCAYGYTKSHKQNIEVCFKEANAKFTYNGKPIHPGLVEEFSSWISDSGTPITISVDVAAAYDTNEYSDSDVENKDGGYIYLMKNGGSEYFFYKWLGKLDNGLHVLRTGTGGGGSGIFEDLYFVRFNLGEGITPEGKKYKRLLMSIVRNYPLGDRDDGEIKVLNDRVIVGKSRYRNDPIIIKFDE